MVVQALFRTTVIGISGTVKEFSNEGEIAPKSEDSMGT
jgi:hypothetical protein